MVYTPPKQQQRQVYGKWKIPWQGPYKVTKKLNSTNYVVKRSSRAKDFIVHGDRLKLYHGKIDTSAWPTDNGGGQQSSHASAGTASTGDQSSVSQQSPAQLGSAQANDQRVEVADHVTMPVGRHARHPTPSQRSQDIRDPWFPQQPA